MNKMYFQTLVKHRTPTMVQWLESKFTKKEVQGSNLASFTAYVVARFLGIKLLVLGNFRAAKNI